MRDLEKLCQQGHQNTRSDQQDQHGKSPHEPVDSTVDFCNLFNGSDGRTAVPCRYKTRHCSTSS